MDRFHGKAISRTFCSNKISIALNYCVIKSFALFSFTSSALTVHKIWIGNMWIPDTIIPTKSDKMQKLMDLFYYDRFDAGFPGTKTIHAFNSKRKWIGRELIEKA